MEQMWAERLAGLEERAAVTVSRVEQLERDQAALLRLVTAVEVLATKQDAMGRSVEVLSGKLDRLEQRPARRWETLIDKVLLVLAGAFLTFLLSGGLSG